jgi:hypothetical protein
MAYNADLRGTTRSSLSINAGHSKNTLTLDASALSGSYTLTFPSTTGSSGQVLSTDGTGTLSWINSTGAVGNLAYIAPATTLDIPDNHHYILISQFQNEGTVNVGAGGILAVL